MEIIPVIDLQGGKVVHAVRGERSKYQPLCSRLCASSDPVVVVQALLDVYPFPTIYIADLDAIQQSGDNIQVIESLLKQFSTLTLWIDRGVPEHRFPESDNIRHVIGSETGMDTGQLAQRTRDDPDCVLSLDFYRGQFLGQPDLLATPACWPERVIAMLLDQVGSSEGPDLETLAGIQQQHRNRPVYAAGGIRNHADIDRLADCGIHGALVATALHTRTITGNDLEKIPAKKMPRKAGHSGNG